MNQKKSKEMFSKSFQSFWRNLNFLGEARDPQRVSSFTQERIRERGGGGRKQFYGGGSVKDLKPLPQSRAPHRRGAEGGSSGQSCSLVYARF